MKPFRIQYILARSFLIGIWVGALLAACIVGWNCYPEMIFVNGSYFFYFVAAVLVVTPLGGLLGAMFFGPLILFAAGKINGAPFHDGDLVHILIGPHKDRIAHIYEIWESRSQVRVDLGEQPGKDVTDVFSYSEVCREKSKTNAG